MAEALGYREQGYSFPQIAAEMKVSLSVAHDWVVSAMSELVTEPAARVLQMELRRLDALLSAHYSAATEGGIAATEMCLRVMDRRARLLGLYPAQGSPQVLIATQGNGSVQPITQIEFVVPTRKPEPEDVQDVSRPPAPPFAWQRALPSPTQQPIMRRNSWGDWEEVK
jgi:hypothetical protein